MEAKGKREEKEKGFKRLKSFRLMGERGWEEFMSGGTKGKSFSN